MDKVIAAVTIIALFLCVGWMEHEPRVEVEVWAVRCTHGVVTYNAPERISLDKEIALCSK